MTAEEAKLWRAQQKIIAQTKELEGGYKKLGQAGKKAGEDGERAARGQAAAQRGLAGMLQRTITQWISVAAVVGTASKAITYFNQESTRARESFGKLAEERRRLVQISVDASDLQKMEALADQVAVEEGVEREITRRVLFSARSEGFEDFFREIIASARVIAPESAAQAAGQVPALFPKAKLTPQQSINAALMAATQSRLTFEQLTATLPGAAEGAGAAGATPAETFALQSVLASRFKSAETAADRIKALGSAIALDKGLTGRGVVAAVKELQAAGEARRKEFLGKSSELNAAFRTIGEELATIEERTRQIDEAIRQADTAQSVLATRRAAAVDMSTEVGRQTTAAIQADRARISRDIANERLYGAKANQRQAALDQAMSTIKQQAGGGWSGFKSEFAAEQAGGWAQWLGLSPKQVSVLSAAAAAGASSRRSPGRAPMMQNLLREMYGPPKELQGAAHDLSKAARDLQEAARARGPEPHYGPAQRSHAEVVP
jgi:hypothetical protein